MGCGDVCLLTEARRALDQGEECLSIKLTEHAHQSLDSQKCLHIPPDRQKCEYPGLCQRSLLLGQATRETSSSHHPSAKWL
jgi:hypothetical protein